MLCFCLCTFVRTFFLRLDFAVCLYCTTRTTQTFMPPSGFEPATPASDRPQILALNRSATETRIRFPDRLALDESLNRLRYTGPPQGE